MTSIPFGIFDPFKVLEEIAIHFYVDQKECRARAENDTIFPPMGNGKIKEGEREKASLQMSRRGRNPGDE